MSSPDVDLVVISGLSGAGRSEAAKAFEDLGWFVIDNLPPQLLEKMLSLALTPGALIDRIAVVIDSRGGIFFDEAGRALDGLGTHVSYRLLFLEAADDVLVKRFDASRRRHPLAGGDNVSEGIAKERQRMHNFRDRADLVIETTDLSAKDLRERIGSVFGGDRMTEGLRTTVVSFGFKHGLPLDSDLVLDVRFLPNPHWVDSLRPHTGRDEPVRRYVLDQPVTRSFLDKTCELLSVLLPGYESEGRHYLTLAVGCTGGRHRSVVLAEEISRFIADQGFATQVTHRDVERVPRA
jgi:UPF0042 nucleotide-binding protein